MQLFQKLKKFHQFFIAFLKSTSNLQHYGKKIKFIPQLYPILLTPKDLYLNVLKEWLRNVLTSLKHC